MYFVIFIIFYDVSYLLYIYIYIYIYSCNFANYTQNENANEALRVNDLHVKSMQRCDRQSCGANEAALNTQRELSVWGV